jgi:tetratricopeptide (TPR) repeat protein
VATLVYNDEEESFVSLRARGNLLDREHRYAEAVAAYERALELAPPDDDHIHINLMMHMALSHFNAGRPAETLRWAEAVIGLDPTGSMRPGARRLAALACGNLGRLDEAERHARAGVELAPSAEQRAEALALLAEYVVRRGDLDEAERTARDAEAMLPGQKRMPWFIIARIERERGCLEEAVRALEQARSIPMGQIPAARRRVDAAIDVHLATAQVQLGRADFAPGAARSGRAGTGRRPEAGGRARRLCRPGPRAGWRTGSGPGPHRLGGTGPPGRR